MKITPTNFPPLPNEQISVWAARFNAKFRTMPDDRHLRATEHWVCVEITNAKDGTQQTDKLHNALNMLSTEYDGIEEQPFYWSGKSNIWFTDDDEAVMFKLKLPSL